MEPQNLSATPFFLDKSWFLAVLTPVLLIVSKKLGVQLDPALVVTVVLPVIGFIVASKAKQAVVLKTQIEQGHFEPKPSQAAPVVPEVVVK